jgi:putative tricarboxylic transport membrane protein
MRRLAMPLAPLVLGFLLGPMFEQALRQSIALSGSPTIFFTRPIAFSLIVAAVLVLGFTIVLRHRSRTVSDLIKDSATET